jgi:ATP-dependent DNA helicase RecQ
MTKRKISDEIREIVDRRDRGKCQSPECELSRMNGDQMNIHHVLPEQFGGTEDPSNLITLCDIHHKAMHIEFSAFYPDSQSVLFKMNYLLNRFNSRTKRLFGVDDGHDLQAYLKLLTGHEKFRPHQLEVIRAALKGRDVLFVTPTGVGKSLCYQLPGLLDRKPTLVISPLKSLMKDQVEGLWRHKIPATYINSDLSDIEKKQRFAFIQQHLYKFLFVAPERFFKSSDIQNEYLYQPYSHLVVDEAHEIDLWGKTFRSSYRQIGTLHERLGKPPVIALTASASIVTQDYIVSNLGLHEPLKIVTGFYRSNISIHKHIASMTADSELTRGKAHILQDIMQHAAPGKILIFVPTVNLGRDVISVLAEDKIEAEFYHSKLETKSKMHIQDRFAGIADPPLRVLVATTAFGMGINITRYQNSNTLDGRLKY